MTAFFRHVASLAVLMFVISSMLNVGLTQRPSMIMDHLANWHYLVRMVLVNLIVVPALMAFALELVPLKPAYAAGLPRVCCSSGHVLGHRSSSSSLRSRTTRSRSVRPCSWFSWRPPSLPSRFCCRSS